MVNSKNKQTLSHLGFDPDLSGPVAAVENRTGLACLINSKIHYKSPSLMPKYCFRLLSETPFFGAASVQLRCNFSIILKSTINDPNQQVSIV